jgi:hypothetical protein
MKKASLRIILFGITLVLLDRGLHYFFQTTFGKLETVGLSAALEAKAELVIFGNSRAFHHYDPNVLERVTGQSAFNAGRDGLGIPYMRGVSDVLLNTYHPKTVIIEIRPRDIRTVFCRNQIHRVAWLAPYMNQSGAVKDMLYRQGWNQRIKYLSKAYCFNSQPLYFFYDLVKRKHIIKGYEPLSKQFTLEKARKTPRQGLTLSFDMNAECISLLRSAIRDIKKCGASVFLITSPKWGGMAAYEPDVLPIFSFYEQLADQEGVPYLKIMEEAYPEFSDISLFADRNHLNRKGATILSNIIGTLLVEGGAKASGSD